MSIRPDCTAENNPLNGDVDDLDGFVEPPGNLLDEVQLEADELARCILEFPGNIANVRAHDQVGRTGDPTSRYEQQKTTQQ